MKQKTLIIILICLVIVAGTVGYFLFRQIHTTVQSTTTLTGSVQTTPQSTTTGKPLMIAETGSTVGNQVTYFQSFQTASLPVIQPSRR